MFWHVMMPMSTMVPIAMAMPESDTRLASTLKSRIAMKENATASGMTALTSSESFSCAAMTITTMVVIRICS